MTHLALLSNLADERLVDVGDDSTSGDGGLHGQTGMADAKVSRCHAGAILIPPLCGPAASP